MVPRSGDRHPPHDACRNLRQAGSRPAPVVWHQSSPGNQRPPSTSPHDRKPPPRMRLTTARVAIMVPVVLPWVLLCGTSATDVPAAGSKVLPDELQCHMRHNTTFAAMQPVSGANKVATPEECCAAMIASGRPGGRVHIFNLRHLLCGWSLFKRVAAVCSCVWLECVAALQRGAWPARLHWPVQWPRNARACCNPGGATRAASSCASTGYGRTRAAIRSPRTSSFTLLQGRFCHRAVATEMPTCLQLGGLQPRRPPSSHFRLARSSAPPMRARRPSYGQPLPQAATAHRQRGGNHHAHRAHGPHLHPHHPHHGQQRGTCQRQPHGGWRG